MKLAARGLLTDHLGRIFLARSADAEALVPPGRALDPGQLPPDAVAATFREQTGLIVMPVRLTGVYYDSREEDHLTFFFRCTMRGGQLEAPEGTAGFFDASPLPAPMRARDRQMVADAMSHAGGPAVTAVEAAGLGERLSRLLGRGPEETPGPSWQVIIKVVDGESKVASAPTRPGEAPWDTAAQLAATGGEPPRLVGVYVSPVEPRLALAFTGRAVGPEREESPRHRRSDEAEAPESVDALIVSDAARGGPAVFRLVDGPAAA